MQVYKLTDENWESYGKTKWGPGVTHTAKGEGGKLCTNGLLHYYHDPLVALMVAPAHVDFNKPVLWLAEADTELVSDGLKAGAKQLTTVSILPIPQITTHERVRFALYIALHTYEDKNYKEWASRWLTGEDRSESAAWAARRAARSAESTAWSAESAARSARSAEELIIQAAHWAVKE